LGIHIVMVMRPEVSELKGKIIYNSVDDVVEEIKKLE
jgi:tetrahydromethanopterin S-methyltransferase subunit B